MRYLPTKTNLFFYLTDLDHRPPPYADPRFTSYDSTILPEKGERITGPFGYYGAEIEVEVLSCEPADRCHYVMLRWVEDGRCFYCRSSVPREHLRLENKYLCPAVVQENVMSP